MTAWEVFALLVAGEPVAVAFVWPDFVSPDGVRVGCAYRARSGQLQIELHPALSDDDLLEVFLHECGHCIAHADAMRPVRDASERISMNTIIAVSRAVNPALVPTLEALHAVDEDAADRLTRAWLDFADRQVGADASTSAKVDALIDGIASGNLRLGRDP